VVRVNAAKYSESHGAAQTERRTKNEAFSLDVTSTEKAPTPTRDRQSKID